MADTPPPTGRRSVLIVDDDPNFRHLLADYVTTMEAEALQASNGLEALWIVKHQRPDVVLVDLRMPRLDGHETIRHIRKFDPRIHLVVITGDTSESTRGAVERLGLELVVKPIDLRALDALLARALAS